MPWALAVSIVMGGLWRVRRLADSRTVDTLADLLAQAVHGQWRQTAAEWALVTPAPIPVRWSPSSLPMAEPVEAMVGAPDRPPAFPPLPGQVMVSEGVLRAGGGLRELFAVYGGIASGRVVVVGRPGAGKSGAAVLLLLEALAHRDGVDDEDRARVPVPVLFTPHDWDPTTRSVQDWLTARLAVDYPLFQHRRGHDEAAALVNAGAVAIILDGLDELHQAARVAALQALSDAPFRVVVLTRSEEMVQTASDTWLVGAAAVQLRDVAGPEGADYLQRALPDPPPAEWTRLLTHLREHPESIVAHGLSTPLALTLLRDTYRVSDDISELLDTTRYRTGADFEQHLISRVLPTAYTPCEGTSPPRYSLTQAHRVLTFMAQRMNQDHTRDLAWWRIPSWGSTTLRVIASMITGGLLFELLFGLPFGLLGGLGVGFLGGLGGRAPKRVKDWRAVSLRSILAGGLMCGLMYGLVSGLWAGIVFQLWAGLVSGLVAGIMYGLVVVYLSLVESGHLRAVGLGRLLRPVIGVVWALAVVPMFGLMFGLAWGVASGLLDTVVPGLQRSGLYVPQIALPLALVIGYFVCGLVCGLLGFEIMPYTDPQARRLPWPYESQVLVWVVGISLLIYASGMGFISAQSWLGPGLVTPLVSSLGPVSGLGLVTSLGLMFGLVSQCGGGIMLPADGPAQGPRDSWHYDRVFWLRVGFVAGLGIGLICLGSGLASGSGLVYGLLIGLVVGNISSVTWPTTLAWLQLQCFRCVPAVGLMAFLEDARTRGVLRTVGTVYQFRHPTLQDYLAKQTTSSPPACSATQHTS